MPSKFYGIAAAGRPVVAVVERDGEIARAINDLKCGYVVEPGDSAELARVVTDLADNRMLGHKLGRRARAGSDRKFARHLALARWSWIIRNVTTEPVASERPQASVPDND